MCTMVVTQLPTVPLLLLLLAVKLGARGTVHSLLRGPTGAPTVLGLRESGGEAKALGWSSRTFHVAAFSLGVLLRPAALFFPPGLPSESVRTWGLSAGLGAPVQAWLAGGWWTCVVLLDLRRLLTVREPPGPSGAFLLGSLPATTEKRAMGLVVEALLGRQDTGGGRPVRLRSTPSELPSGVLAGRLAGREPFMGAEQALSRQDMQRAPSESRAAPPPPPARPRRHLLAGWVGVPGPGEGMKQSRVASPEGPPRGWPGAAAFLHRGGRQVSTEGRPLGSS